MVQQKYAKCDIELLLKKYEERKRKYTWFTDGQVKVVTSSLAREVSGSLTFVAPCFEHCMTYEKCIEERIHHGNVSLHVRFVHLHVFISTTSYCMVSLFTCTPSFQQHWVTAWSNYSHARLPLNNVLLHDQ